MTDLRTPPVHDGDLFSERARRYASDKSLPRPHVLEAGCGWGEGLDLGAAPRQVTGVDMDSPELRAHTRERADLDAYHLGDLRTVPMPPREYDIVHAAFLIERLTQAELVLDRFVAALKPGGLLLLRYRDRDTAFGFLDRFLPARLRRPARRWPTRDGRPRQESPPPAVYEPVASLKGMHWYCVMRGLVIAEEYASRDSVTAFGHWRWLVRLLCRAVSLLTRGRLTSEHSEVTLVIRKPENRFARVL